MTNKISTITDSDIVSKYNGKRIRVNGRVYRIVISLERRIGVYLEPMFADADRVDNFIDYDTYRYSGAGQTYQLAVQKAKEIAREIEEQLATDFEVKA